MKPNNGWVIGCLVALLQVGCSGSPPLPAQQVSAPVINRQPTEITSQLEPTATPIPPSPTPTPTATATPLPAATATLTPSPSPAPTLRQLTGGGCCVQPFFSPDGRQVLFIDKPNPQAPVGIYGVNLADPQPTPELVSSAIGFYNPDRSVVATIEGELARFTNESTGQSWAVNTGGNRPYYAPDGARFLWSASDREGPYDRRKSEIWLAGLDGSNPRLLLTVTGGGFVGWLPNSRQILLIDRQDLSQEEQTLVLYDIENERRTNLLTEKRIRGVEISPGGSWIAYYLTFADDPQKDGIWLMSSDGSERLPLNAPGFGAYQWRNDNSLIFIPMRSSPQESMQLWSIDVPGNNVAPLTDPARLAFSISNGDWGISPDGQQIVFVNSQDQNLWLITLPP